MRVYLVYLCLLLTTTQPGNILNVVLIHCDLISDLTEEQNALHTDNKRNNCIQILLPVYISIDELTRIPFTKLVFSDRNTATVLIKES